MFPAVLRTLRDWDAAVRLWSSSRAWRSRHPTIAAETWTFTSQCQCPSPCHPDHRPSFSSPSIPPSRSLSFLQEKYDAPVFTEWRGPEPGTEPSKQHKPPSPRTQPSPPPIKRSHKESEKLQAAESDQIGLPYTWRNADEFRPQFHDPPFQHTQEDSIRVGRSSNIKMTAGAIAAQVRKEGKCVILAAGKEPINQCVKALAVARILLKERSEGDLYFQPYHLFKHDRRSSNQMSFHVFKIDMSFENTVEGDVARIGAVCNHLQAGVAMSKSAKEYGMSSCKAIGAGAVASAVVSITWARRNLLRDNHDLQCYPEFKIITTEYGEDLHCICLTMKLFQLGDTPSEGLLDVVDPPVFKMPLDELKDASGAFGEFKPMELHPVKIGFKTAPQMAAAAVLTFLRRHGGVHCISVGQAANNQALKAFAITRIYVRECAGYDIALQTLHHPSHSTTGDCQISTWVLLVKQEEDRPKIVDEDIFRISKHGNTYDIGQAIKSRVAAGRRVRIHGMGVSSVSRMLTSLSCARAALHGSGLDIVGYPEFDYVNMNREHHNEEFVRVAVEFAGIERKSRNPAPDAQEQAV